MQPLSGKVIIYPKVVSDISAGGIILVQKEEPDTATVLAVSEDESFLEVGDTILYRKGSGAAVRFDSNDALIVSEDDVWAKI